MEMLHHRDCRNFAPVDVAKGICHRTKNMVPADGDRCEECVATPRRASSSPRSRTAFVAPRYLKAPALWKHSALRWSRAPDHASKVLDVRTGVRFA